MKRIRIGNVEYRESNGPRGTYEEIVLWDGETFDDETSKNRPTCYTVADIEWNRAHDEFNVRSIGTRAFRLGRNDSEDFLNVLTLIEKYSTSDEED